KSEQPGRAAAAVALGAVVVALALARGGRVAAGPPVVVGSKNFTEQVILGEIVAAHLEGRGFRVDRRLNLGGTSLCHAAVRSGQLDLYVEYTGTALTDVLKRPVANDPAVVLDTVRDGYRDLGLTVGAPLGFNNSYALVMRNDC